MPPLEAIRAERARRAAERERERIARDGDAIRARCQTLAGFVREAWHVLEPNQPYVHNWHIDAICEHLEAVTDGLINRLLVNVPPGSSKSLIISVLWPAWEWGPRNRPSLRYLTTAHNDVPVKRDTRKHRDLTLSDWYRGLWPHVELTRTGETSFANSATGNREGVAFGSLTSQRGDRLIIDDPHSTETAESPAERLTTTRRFREGATNRLNDQERSAIVVVMQRLHAEDVAGQILKLKMGYVHLMLPMEFEATRACSTSIGFTDPRTEDGDLLDPIRFPRPVVENLKRDMGAYAWAGQYQQRPGPREGGLFKRSWFGFVAAIPVGPRRRVRAWDLAATKKATGIKPDWTVGLLMSQGADKRFLIEGTRRLQGSPGEVSAAIDSAAKQDGTGVTIRLPQDPGQAGKSQADTFIKMLAGYSVIAKVVTGDKATRASPAATQAEAGNIVLLRTGDEDRDAWIEPFLAEVELFPAGAHDDQVDALSDAVNELALGSRYSLEAL